MNENLMTVIKCPGQFRDEIAGLFSECWLFNIEERIVGGKVQYIRTVRTVPAATQSPLGLKTSLALGDKFDLDLATIGKKIQEAAVVS